MLGQERLTAGLEALASALEGPCQLHLLLLGRKGHNESEIGKSLLGNESYSSLPSEKSDCVVKLKFTCINCFFCK